MLGKRREKNPADLPHSFSPSFKTELSIRTETGWVDRTRGRERETKFTSAAGHVASSEKCWPQVRFQGRYFADASFWFNSIGLVLKAGVGWVLSGFTACCQFFLTSQIAFLLRDSSHKNKKFCHLLWLSFFGRTTFQLFLPIEWTSKRNNVWTPMTVNAWAKKEIFFKCYLCSTVNDDIIFLFGWTWIW